MNKVFIIFLSIFFFMKEIKASASADADTTRKTIIENPSSVENIKIEMLAIAQRRRKYNENLLSFLNSPQTSCAETPLKQIKEIFPSFSMLSPSTIINSIEQNISLWDPILDSIKKDQWPLAHMALMRARFGEKKQARIRFKKRSHNLPLEANELVYYNKFFDLLRNFFNPPVRFDDIEENAFKPSYYEKMKDYIVMKIDNRLAKLTQVDPNIASLKERYVLQFDNDFKVGEPFLKKEGRGDEELNSLWKKILELLSRMWNLKAWIVEKNPKGAVEKSNIFPESDKSSSEAIPELKHPSQEPLKELPSESEEDFEPGTATKTSITSFYSRPKSPMSATQIESAKKALSEDITAFMKKNTIDYKDMVKVFNSLGINHIFY